MIRSRAAAVLVTVAAVLPVAGCFQGFDGTVNTQGPTGNGTDFEVGDSILVQDATIVVGGAGGDDGALLLTLVNDGELDDALESVTTVPASTPSLSNPIEVRSSATIRVATNAEQQVTLEGLAVPAGSYAEVTFAFRQAGESTQRVAVVPATGYYAGLGPAGTPDDAGTEAPAGEETPEGDDGHGA